MTKILSLETATEACSASVLHVEGNELNVYKRFDVCPREHTQRILPMLEEVLKDAESTLEDVDVVAFGKGPGAFTGLRIAAGITQGISLANDIPVVPVSTLAALAHQVVRKKIVNATNDSFHIFSAIDARMGEVYWCVYSFSSDQGLVALTAEQVTKPDELKDEYNRLLVSIKGEAHIYLIGSGWNIEEMSDVIEGNVNYLSPTRYPTAEDIAYIALREYENKNSIKSEKAKPTYIRNNVAKKLADQKNKVHLTENIYHTNTNR